MSAAIESVMPIGITDHRASAVLLIAWNDGHTSALPHGLLRQRCRCASCTQAARQGAPLPAPAAVIDIHPMAENGLHLVFADGHARGLYPWAYLRALGDEQRRAEGRVSTKVGSAPNR
ncbi:DUF971 domain-containing protein [Denitromonas iodatirespirans]|uniref:DUF971 domain-containing protein n=1 Tax=Denitromonas iodatirespirans TaxID=2795389 RepID=A0A944HC12_DENI1|nr:DUF971 domain-containing protein [Denitromonas iodatirespirans]MBT0962227.1 DUF971 domain-containing protein [Denitromonas iodatirespirans]